jgi:hypothetical protein
VSNAQVKKEVNLKDLNDELLESINNQGLKLFKKAYCYHKNENYFSIPNFIVGSQIPLKDLSFESSKGFLSNLYFIRDETKKLSTEISWNIFLKKNEYVQANSDFRQFYCYDENSIFTDIINHDKFEIKKIKYTFYMYDVDITIAFLVNEDDIVFVYLYREHKIIALTELKKKWSEHIMSGY